MQGTIVKALAGFYYVESDNTLLRHGSWKEKDRLLCGDQVEFSAEENSGWHLSIALAKIASCALLLSILIRR